jgi:hypothetical protein
MPRHPALVHSDRWINLDPSGLRASSRARSNLDTIKAHMAKRQRKTQTSWSDIKTKLAGFDRAGLLGLIQELYAAHWENRVFLHARFGSGEDALRPYKQTIRRCLAPDMPSDDEEISITQARQAISDYKKALGDPEGLAELMVFYCEQAAGFADKFGPEGSYCDSLCHMFERALKLVCTLPEEKHNGFMERLQAVCETCDFGYGVGDFMADLLEQYGVC